ncbi:hypothetical protein EUGRSUZ_B00931 [Eucalyptus grandis]|uniref:Uncharacterized protein n=2 Tax=Eucalyptus grandis TaxID=71139 RepID=A0ACC3L235_EUCGR|nr:hypothetical protein EUGRSUZ_B00931 [Eucalyptus grandis]
MIIAEYIWSPKIGGQVPKRCRQGLVQDISYPAHKVDKGIYQCYMIRLGDMDRSLKGLDITLFLKMFEK